MKPPESNARLKLIADWLDKAVQDIRASETLLSQDPPLLPKPPGTAR